VPPTTRDLAWSEASWLNPPAAATEDGAALLVDAREGSDFWRTTGYGFVRDDGHALLTPFPAGTAVEVDFAAGFTEQFDQAGVLVRVSPQTWIKAGVEFSDGELQLGAVVTHGASDWSLAPVPDWAGRDVTVRVSRSGDAVTVRARCADQPWRTVRLAHLDPAAEATAGLYCCAPSRAGLRVRFTRLSTGPADTSLH
jgi:regulation of enolase protein 1 (concanavalin A-like superfamily)